MLASLLKIKLLLGNDFRFRFLTYIQSFRTQLQKKFAKMCKNKKQQQQQQQNKKQNKTKKTLTKF